MNCNQMETVLLDYAAGRLARVDRAALERHLSVCQDCRERAAGFRNVAQILGDWETPEISPWFNARLRQRIAEEEALQWNWRGALGWLKQPVTAAAFAAVLVVGSLAVWTARPSMPPSPALSATPVANLNRQKPEVDELMPVVEDFDMLADFEVIQDLKTSSTVPHTPDKM